MTQRPSACRLCLTPGDVVFSHIVPEFLYGEMYDSLHRFNVLSGNPEKPEELGQKGIREYLFCSQCDNVLISGFESYGHDLFCGGPAVSTVKPIRQGKTALLTNLDYHKLRLFFLSILYRMSIAEGGFWRDVNLGPHEEIIRRMLLEQRPGAPDEYGILWIAPLLQGKYEEAWMLQPVKGMGHGRTIYRCVIAGSLFCFCVGKSRVPTAFSELFLRDDGTWRIIFEDVQEIDFLAAGVLQLGKAMKKRRQLQGV